MNITGKINISEIDKIAVQIHSLIQKEKSLTERKLHEIVKSLYKGNFYFAIKDTEVIGFICREKLLSEYHEIKSWYVKPNFRKKGVGNMLMKSALSDKRGKYISVTFFPEIQDALKKYGFKDISLSELPFRVMMKYIFTRNYRSVFKHIFRNKSNLLMKL